jgi:hypothetical protein
MGMLAIGSINAQVNKSNVSPLVKRSSQDVTVKKTSVKPRTAQEKAAIIWSDDFDQSAASEWVINTTGTNPEGWAVQTGPYDFVTAINFTTLLSATNSNGYLMVNSDLNGGGGSNADSDGKRITTKARTAVPISLFGYSNVRLRFEHNFRWWHDTRGVRVSGDNGVTWTDFRLTDQADYNLVDDITTTTIIEGNYEGLQSSENAEVTTIDISTIAGNATQVLLEFYYDDNDYWGWYWAIDDVSIEVIEDYDLLFYSAFFGSTGAWGERLPYFKIPTDQIAPIEFSGGVKNNGALDQTGITVTTTVGAFNATSLGGSIARALIDTLDCPGSWTPASTLGASTVNMSTISGNTDGYMADNTFDPYDIEVVDHIYSRDNGVFESGAFNGGEGFEMGNIYDMYAAATLQGIDVHIGANAEEGSEIWAKLYTIDATSGDFVFAEESAPYVLTAADLDAVLTLTLLSEQALNANEPYLVVVGSYGDGGNTNDLVVGTSGFAGDFTSYFFDYTDGTWYYTNRTPMVRMNFDPSLGVDEVSNTVGMKVYPNPANTNTTISFSLNNEADVLINVTDLSGKVVYTNALGTLNGTQSVNVNTDALNSGVYMVNVSVDGSVSTQKLVIRK